jgi:hypothetical protein
MNPRTLHNPPKAVRTIEGLRDFGYDVNQAVAELIDNSISAKAKTIRIFFHRIDDIHFLFRLIDDGIGMTKSQLINAMALGSDGKYSENDLGKFGMGLKTASFSQCRKFSVVTHYHLSKKDDITGYKWDLDYITKCNDWDMIEIQKTDCLSDKRFADIFDSSGTVILWENIDRLDNLLKSTQRADLTVGAITGKLELFIRTTFHRFLSGELGKNHTIKIIFNDIELNPWDPFCRDEKNTITLERKEFYLTEINKKTPVIIDSYILPAQKGVKGFSSPKAWNDAKGLLSWNDSQGLYIYRANRLIQYGGWNYTRAKDEHTKYARIAISFNPIHDEAFRTAMDKTRSRLPESLYEYLKNDKFFVEVIKKAKIQYQSENLVHPPVPTEPKGNETTHVLINKDKFPHNIILEETKKISKTHRNFHEFEIFSVKFSDITKDPIWDFESINGKTIIKINVDIMIEDILNSETKENEKIIRLFEFLVGYLGYININPDNQVSLSKLKQLFSDVMTE